MIKNSWELTSTGKIEIPSFEFVLDSVCTSPVGSFEGDCKFAKKKALQEFGPRYGAPQVINRLLNEPDSSA